MQTPKDLILAENITRLILHLKNNKVQKALYAISILLKIRFQQKSIKHMQSGRSECKGNGKNEPQHHRSLKPQNKATILRVLD